MSRPLTFLIAIAVVLTPIAMGYICLSWHSPYAWEIVLGSITLSLLLAAITSLIQDYYKNGFRKMTIALGFLAFASLSFLVAAMLYLSNAPKSIRKEIPVTYLISPRKLEPPSSLWLADTTAFAWYPDMVQMFREFRDKSSENATVVNELAKRPGQRDLKVAPEFFQDFTECLLVKYLGTPVMEGDAGLTMYRKETPKWLGWPNKAIAGDAKSREAISGDFKDNMFYDVNGLPPIIFDLRLPKNTDISLNADGRMSSQLVIRNKFMEIKIGIYFHTGGSWGWGFVSDSALRYGSDKNELRLAFNRYETIIYYDVTFSKWRYAYPEMKHYEEWANDLFAMLRRKFAWGSPPLADEVEVFRRFEEAAASSKD